MNALPQIGNCCENDCDAVTTLVPGAAGDAGADGVDGADGANAFTTVTAGFTVPAVSSNVLLQVGNSSWMAAGQKIFIQNAGYYQFVSSSSATNATVQNLGYTGNAAPAVAVASGNKVSPGGIKGADGTNGADSETTLTTKGDLLTRNATVLVRKAVGTNKYIIHADSAELTGLRYGVVDLTGSATAISGALPLANGGTGQATANLGFNALSPVTTRGDLIVRNATVNARLGIGTTGQVLRSDGTDPSWGKITSDNINMASGPLPRYGLLGSLIGANFNSTADQAITIQSGVTRYIIRRIVVDNASIDFSVPTVPLGGIYTNTGMAGTIIVAAAQSYAALSASTKWKDLTLEAVVGTDVFTATTVYLRLSTAKGAAATANVWIFGENLTP